MSSSTLPLNCSTKMHYSSGQNMGAFVINGRSSRSYCFKNLRNQVLPAFLTRNPYRSGSFQLGPENSSKSGTCSKTPLFYISKLNHTFSRCFHGAQCLVCRNPCSSMRILQKNMELRAGNREPKKTMELLIENAQLRGCAMKCIESFGLNHEHRMILDKLRGAQCLKTRTHCSS